MSKKVIDRDLINVFLVETKDNLNIGAVARAMMNLGFSKLHLILPDSYSIDKASITACWARDILEKIQFHVSLKEALKDMQEVVGFSGRAENSCSGQMFLNDWKETVNISSGKIALLFGPEDTGLTQEHISHCKFLVRIPSANQYRSFNLAQAVLLVLAELSRGVEFEKSQSMPDKPSANDFYQLERIIEEIAQQVEFYGKGTPQPVPFVMRSLLRRLSPNKREMGILLGLFGKVQRKLDRER